jgi:hypothetical protein
MAADKKPITELKNRIKQCIATRRRFIVWGPPGVGKTSMIEALAAEIGLPRVVTLLGSQCAPEDVNGFPLPGGTVKDVTGMEFRVVEFAPRAEFIKLNQTGGLIFLDEISNASAPTRASMLRLLDSAQAGPYQLDEDLVAIGAAANPPDQAEAGSDLGGPMQTRLTHLHYPTDTLAATEWADQFPAWPLPPLGLTPKPLPEPTTGRAKPKAQPDQIDLSEMAAMGVRPDAGQGRKRGVSIAGPSVENQRAGRSLVAGYIMKEPSAWLDPAFRKDKAGKKAEATADGTEGRPTARTWEYASRHLAVAFDDGQNPIEAYPMIAAEIGTAAARQMLAYLKETERPDPRRMLEEPESWTPKGVPYLDVPAVNAALAVLVDAPTAARFKGFVRIVCERVTGDYGGRQAHEAGMTGVLKFFYQKERHQMAATLLGKEEFLNVVRQMIGKYRPALEAAGVIQKNK